MRFGHASCVSSLALSGERCYIRRNEGDFQFCSLSLETVTSSWRHVKPSPPVFDLWILGIILEGRAGGRY